MNTPEAEAAVSKLRTNVNKNQVSSPNPQPFISRTTQTGVVDIKFDKDMMAIPSFVNLKTLQYRVNRFEQAPVFTVSVIPSEVQDAKNVKMKWKILSITPRGMKLQVNFDNPLHVSFEEPDLLEVNFADPDLFLSANGI